MTFLEAAIEILRNADEPMHFSEVRVVGRYMAFLYGHASTHLR